MATQCKAKTRTGAQCSAYAGRDGFCFTHSPAKARERTQARKRGGRNHAIPKLFNEWTRKIESIGDLLELLNLTIADTVAQDNTAARSRALLGAIETGLKCVTQGELEERVKALEQHLKDKGK